jgi:hypothetical protein
MKEELKTSEEWQKQFPNTKVLDPDGWDRKNYQYSWFEEKITLAEYTTRLSRSTVYGIILKEEPKQESFVEKMIPLQLKYNLAMLDVMKQETLEEVKDLSYYKTNAEEDYLRVPISVLRYISELEQTKEIGQKEEEFAIEFAAWVANRIRYDNAKLYFRHSAKELLEIYKQEKEL